MKNKTKIMAEVVVSVALAYVLNLVTVFRMPQGGSVTAVSMVPLLWLALRRGPRIGILGGAIFGLVDLFPQPFIVHPVQFLLDYPLAFGALGLAGLTRSHPIFGTLVGIGGRFVCHFLSGIVFFATYAPEGMSPIIYSAIYNGSYLIVEAIFSSVVIYVLAKRGIVTMYA
jgi:thiamine transporter